MITVDDINFGVEEPGDLRVSYQGIFLPGVSEAIGVLRTSAKNIFSPVEERYQLGCIDNVQIKNIYNWTQSEDSNWMHVYFSTLEEFVDFYNAFYQTGLLNFENR